jgi:hypothetical protein
LPRAGGSARHEQRGGGEPGRDHRWSSPAADASSACVTTLHGVRTSGQHHARQEHVGGHTAATAASARAQPPARHAGTQPATAGIPPRAQLAIAVVTGQLAAGQLTVGAIDVVGDDQHHGTSVAEAADFAHRHTRYPPLTRCRAHPMKSPSPSTSRFRVSPNTNFAIRSTSPVHGVPDGSWDSPRGCQPTILIGAWRRPLVLARILSRAQRSDDFPGERSPTRRSRRRSAAVALAASTAASPGPGWCDGQGRCVDSDIEPDPRPG